MKKKHLLPGCKGCGNAIVEAAFAVAGVPLDYEEVDYSGGGPTRARLLYIAVMTHWRPGRKWFVANTPKLVAIAEKTSATAKVADVVRRNFD